MWSAEIVLVCALSALGRAPSSFPPIELVDSRPPGLSPVAEAFVRTGERRIYLLTTGAVFQAARRADNRCGDYSAIRKLASILVHEEFHIRRPGDERGAYMAQLTALAAMGLDYAHPVSVGVRRSMIVAMERQKPDRTLARRDP
jgi:hypothetical protein